LKDEKFKNNLQEKIRKISADSEVQFKRITEIVEGKIA
jgi:formiminotetrahydrofolate cyclodeaminase